MHRWLRIFLTCCLILQTNITFAETKKTIVFENQQNEVFDLENFLKKTVMVDQEVKGTCTKKVPYEENVCNDVTKYKKECKTVPAHRECKQVNKPICHTETTMENECHNLPSRQECSNVPRQVCGYETRYENECSTTPDRQECRTAYEQECRYETRYEQQCRTVPGEQQCRVVVRYRQECSQTGGGQQCRTIPGEVQCHREPNGENRCVKIPPREECSGTPSRQECRQVPYEERECSQGPSRQECTNVPRQERVCENVPRQQCSTVPGRYECRQVPRQEQVCRTEYERECETIPGDEVCQDVPRQHEVCRDNYKEVCEDIPAKEVCKNVPYTEQVCKLETKYKDEEYECMKTIKVPQEKVVKTHKANVKVEFSVLSEIFGPEFDFDLDTKGNLSVKVSASDAEVASDEKVAAVFAKKDVKANEQGELNNIEARFKFLLLDKKVNLAYLETSELNAALTKDELTFRLNGKVDAKRATLAVSVMRKDKTELDKTISASNIKYQYVQKENYTNVTVDVKAEGAKIGGLLTSRSDYDVKVTFDQNYSDAGEMILSKVKNFKWTKSRTLKLSK